SPARGARPHSTTRRAPRHESDASIPPPVHEPSPSSCIAIQPDQHPLIGHAAEVLTRIRLLPLPTRDPVRSGDGDQGSPASVVAKAHGSLVIPPEHHLHLDRARLAKELEREPRRRGGGCTG